VNVLSPIRAQPGTPKLTIEPDPYPDSSRSPSHTYPWSRAIEASPRRFFCCSAYPLGSLDGESCAGEDTGVDVDIVLETTERLTFHATLGHPTLKLFYLVYQTYSRLLAIVPQDIGSIIQTTRITRLDMSFDMDDAMGKPAR
jgi:hypothetical protein